MSSEVQFQNTLREFIETTTHRSMQAFIRHNRKSSLSLSQVSTLIRLFYHGPSQVNDLAEHLGITMAAVSQLLNQLIDARLILRSTSPSDRRVKLIALTEQGTLTVRKSISARHVWVDDLAQLFTTAEKEELLPCLNLLNYRTQELFQKRDVTVGHHKGKTHCCKQNQ